GYPRRVKPGTAHDPLVLSIDLAPTVLELAGVPVPGDLHGRSLLPLLRGEAASWRRSFLVEHFSDAVFPRVHRVGYQAVRTERWKYVRYTELAGMDELYDLKADPYELKNVLADPGARAALAEMKAELERLLRETR